ncbi:plasmid replication initiator protein [Catellatospora sp. IY07-71]|nr:plasmid replication initiator protein [Catellatospora sp. IY07-71]
MLDAAPRPLITGRGAASNTETGHPSTVGSIFHTALLDRTSQGDYFGWLEHIRSAAGCTRPVRLAGELHTVHRHGDAATVLDSSSTATMPDGTIYKACGNRRASLCPSCARTYQADAYQLLRAGLVGGKGIPATVATHPAVFATFTAPSFGLVHRRVVKRHTCTDRRRCDCRPKPCRARRPADDATDCAHGTPVACFARHDADDPRLGQPFCLDCYDHAAQVVWNLYAGELWRRTKQAIDRELAKLARRLGIPRVQVGIHPVTGHRITKPPVHTSCGKVAEFQTRGAVHFHALIRLDGVDADDPDAIAAPAAAFTAADLDAAIRAAAASIDFTTPAHPDQPAGWRIAWGDPRKGIDVRPINLDGAEVTDSMAAGYLAKYATKSTEATGHASVRLTDETIDYYADPDGSHAARLVAACWRLGRPTHKPVPLGDRPRRGDAVLPPATTARDINAENPYAGLRRWAHMLGFGGHFMSKSRRYSVTFGQLRAVRTAYRRAELPDHPGALQIGHDDQDHEDTILVVGTLAFAGVGWHTSADALLANTAAAMARERAATGREEIAHELGTTPPTPHPLEHP